jgi:hypothetical protein
MIRDSIRLAPLELTALMIARGDFAPFPWRHSDSASVFQSPLLASAV